MSKRVSFRFIRKPEDGHLPRTFPFWVGTFVGSFFVIFAFLVAVADISRASRAHSSTLDFLNLDLVRRRIVHVPSGIAAPQVSILSPLPGKALSGSVPLEVSASGRSSALVSVRLYVDNQDKGELLAPYRLNWDTALLRNGEHTLRTVAVDAAGGEASASVRVFVEN